jgi:hypothetical protein
VGSSGIAVAVVLAVVCAVTPGSGVVRGCIGLPRLGSNSFPPCLPCQVGADTALDAAEVVQTVGAVAGSDIEDLWVAPEASRDCLAGGMDQDYLRPVRSR